MSLDNFRNRTIIWDTVNKDFPQPIQIMQGDANARTLLIKIVDNGVEIDLTGHSLKLTYQYTNSSNSGFVMIPPKDLAKGEFILVIPTEMTATGVIEANLILLNKDKEQVIVSKNLTFISDSSTVSDLAQEVNNKIDDFTKLLLENMPQVVHSELNGLHADVSRQGIAISTKAEQSELSITNQNVTTAQETANKAESDAKTAMAKATEAQSNSLPLTGIAVSAIKLATPRKLRVNLQSSSFQYFDGTADATDIGVSGVLPIEHGGTSTSDGVINTTAYSNSADGTEDFTTVYPNLNLLDGTRDFSGDWERTWGWENDGYYKGLTVKKQTHPLAGGICKRFTAPKDGVYTFSAYVKGSGSTANIYRYVDVYNNYGINVKDMAPNAFIGNNFDWLRDSFTVTLKAGYSLWSRYEITGSGTDSALWTAGHKWEEGPIATLWMPSASEVTVEDYPKYVGFSNSIKPNKKSSDYNWLPMGLVSIDRATGLLKPPVMGIDYAQAHPVGSVVTNTSSSSSGYSTGTWENIGEAVIGSTTIYYWKRTA